MQPPKPPTAFEMERIIAFKIKGKLVTDIGMQRQDIDIIASGGTTISVKKQDAAARSGNISLEVEQIDTRTGAAVPGNFSSCKAQCIVIVIPCAGREQYEAHIWEHAKLAELAKNPRYRRAHLTQERLEANRQRGNRYDDAVSVLIPLSDARKVSAGSLVFDVAKVTNDPAFQAFAKQNPNTQREF